MRRGSGWRLALILAIIVTSGIVLGTMEWNLGLDLVGGVHVVLQAEDPDVDSDTMERTLAVIERRVNATGVAEPVIQRQGSRRVVVELPGIEDQQQAVDMIGRTALLEFKDPFGQTVLTGSDLAVARLGRDRFNQPAVDIEFNRDGAVTFAEMTARYVGQTSRIVLDGELLSEVTIREAISGGQAQITGRFSDAEARELAVLLQAGSLPVPLDVLEIRNVGATLGADLINSSLRAGIVGIILVLLYILLMYRLPGGVADIALGVYVLIVLASLVALRATLTLPGVAGFILSIGMAVDANVIIFERIKEELKTGKRLRPAIESGFSRALHAIVDANITTLITAAVLYNFGTSVVRGFAVTLSLGIVASMFTAIVVTRFLLVTIVDHNPERMGRWFFPVKGVAK